MKKCLLSTIVAGVSLYLLGFLIYGLLLMDIIANDAMKDPPVMWAIPVAQLIAGAVIAVILDWRGVSDFAGGFRGGAFVGVLLSVSYSIMIYASLDLGMTLGLGALDALAAGVMWGVAGGFVGVVHGRMADA